MAYFLVILALFAFGTGPEATATPPPSAETKPPPTPTVTPTPEPNVYNSSKPVTIDQTPVVHKQRKKKRSLADLAGKTRIKKGSVISDHQVDHVDPNAEPPKEGKIPTYIKDIYVEKDGSFALRVTITLADKDGNVVAYPGELRVYVSRDLHSGGTRYRDNVFIEKTWVDLKDFKESIGGDPKIVTRRLKYGEFSGSVRDKVGDVFVGFKLVGGPILIGESVVVF